MPGKRTAQKERTRTAIIAAALHMFAQDGFYEARTSDIAESANVSHGTVFLHFPTRDDLLAATIEEFGMKIALRLHESLEKGNGMRHVLAAHVDGLMEYETFYARLVTQGTILPLIAQNVLVMIQSAVSFHLSQVAEREMTAGMIRRMPLHLLFNTWLGLIHYYLANRQMFAPGASVLKRYGHELLNHFLALISVSKHIAVS